LNYSKGADGQRSKRKDPFPGIVTVLFLAVFLVLGACSEAVELTPEQKALFGAWNITKEISRDYGKEDQPAILSLLSPSIRADGHVAADLSALFVRLDHVRLHLTADSGVEDDRLGTMLLRSHWVLSGMVVGAKPGQGGGYLKAGECRLLVSIPKPGQHAILLSITGDDFLRVQIVSGQKAG
jgi:hypothetical protein